MLEHITWAQLLSVIIVGTTIYFAFYILKYFQDEIIEKLRINGWLNEIQQLHKEYRRHWIKEDRDLQELETIVNNIRTNILERAGDLAIKERLIMELMSCVANYNGLQKPAFRYALNDYIIKHSKVICGVVFEEEELELLWNNMPRYILN